MNIFIVYEQDYDGDEILGITDTLKQAAKWVDK